MSHKQKLNNDWYFSKHPLGTELDAIVEPNINWSPVTLPHDWLIYDSGNLYENGVGWYRKTIVFDALDPRQRIALRFEGVYMNSTIYINGQEAGTWKNGYSTFEVDLTSFLVQGDNEILVQVIHESPNSRWYSGAGIYRSVWLITSSDTHLASDGIYISARKNAADLWSVQIDAEIAFSKHTNLSSEYKLRHTIRDAESAIITQFEAAIQPHNDSTARFNQMLNVHDPNVWDLDQPYCYMLQTELIMDGIVLDSELQTFGFRTFDFNTEKGFFLNGRHVKLQGVCQHHDLGSLGAAVNKSALRRQIALLQEMGVNAIRTAHNMPAVELMELADEMGVLIVSEAYDMWERSKTPYDFARFYAEWWKKDIASWVRRDRNHPSMLMWSIGNEIYDTHADERGQVLTAELRNEVELHDPKGNAVVTIGSNYMPWENAQKCADLVKFAGYNYGDKYYKPHHEQHPDWFIYGSETCSTVQSRGIYHFPLAQSVLADDDEQCSSLGNSSTSWGAKSTEACIIADRDAPFSIGQFLWTGFDYIGEPTPYHTKNSYFGQIDTAGFKKDAFYIYQAEWTDYKTDPMVHIFPYWDFSEGQLIDVRVCSNAPKIELFFNEVSLGTYEIDHKNGQQLLGEWQIPYAKGVLRAVAYDEFGNRIATDIQSSFGDAASIRLTPDRITMAADGEDLIFIEISALDQNGLSVANANNRVHISVEGPGRLVGLDNGDSTDYDSYKGTHRRMFSGKLLAIIAPTLESGTVTVRAVSNGLIAGEIVLTAIDPSPAAPGEEYTLYDYAPEQQAALTTAVISLENDEIPVRKMEIVCPQGNSFAEDRRSLPVQVIVHPSNATYQEVEWRVTNAAGVDANIATLKADGHQAEVTAVSDGEFYIRCATRNGSDNIRLYSVMEMRITGIGEAFINPYAFVSAGYHSQFSRNLTNGNERGVATSRDGESWICFDHIDFGSFGSDEITLPIFSLDSERFTFEIWEGIPSDPSSTLVTQLTYQKPTRWNVYQEETYRLPRRLKGITSLTFVLRRKIHLKGFQFRQAAKAFERLEALENTHIYGDTFKLANHAIENIGNNVSLVFEEMDFGTAGTSKLVICGQYPIDNNTIHVLFSGVEGETKQLIEFPYSEQYVEREYVLDCMTGMQTVTFIFLPGSQFHFQSFQFMRE
ncbi:glycoside hydrolase family 2 TIM barrel-domain containing protein [Paenibacillus glycanilyticus]|uniref:Beta-galactosidase n=1 Tax=Paenibacillus glycanilyticus TaxID=126569 RepID=A0ABQ6GKY0_9BACL|nr:glycoside hydrolase family 2 TIM barrel-domain containing protein [Paenibacillus glycanilyticus]GLX71534.1 hypothetical protein MU1_58840 [Paenibacillus glycanilyticus]